MVTKHLLTLLHCVIAVVVISTGVILASQVADRQPIMALIGGLGAIILPVAIATRVSWAAGYAAGRQASTRSQYL